MGKFPRKVTGWTCQHCDAQAQDQADLMQEGVKAYRGNDDDTISEDIHEVVEEINAVKCLHCGELAEDEDDLIETTDLWQCVTCDETHEDRDDAYNCCD